MEPVDDTSGDVEADACPNGHDLVAQRRLSGAGEEGERFFHRMGVWQHALPRLKPLLGDENALRPIPRRNKVL